MLYGEIIIVGSETYTKCLNTQCGQNEEFLGVIPSGIEKFKDQDM